MKRLIVALAVLFFGVQFSLATTYFKNWVNGNESNTLTQGDMYAWEYDVSASGGSADVQIYVDANSNQTLDSADVLLIDFTQQDGQTGTDGPPPDSSAVPDGIIFTFLGPMGFPQGDYLFHVTDLNDSSTVTGVLHINPPAQVNVWVKGHLTIKGITPPDSRLANFMFEATLEANEDGGNFWGGLTDENGDFTINLPDTAVGNAWKIGFMFESQISQYVSDSVSYHNVSIHDGENGIFYFNLSLPSAWVYGSVLDETGNLVPTSGWGSLENLHSGQETDFNVVLGQYKVGAPFTGDDTSNVPFRLNYDDEQLIPDYLMPDTWGNPNYQFNLSLGDSVEKNIYVYSSDTVIYVIGLKDGHPMNGNVRAWAHSDLYGQTFAKMNGDSVIKLHVHHGSIYNLWLSNTDYGQFKPPAGYYLEGGNGRTASPGDTVVFELIPTSGSIRGHIRFAPGDSVGDLRDCVIRAYTYDWSKNYTAGINPDSMNFVIGVPNDTFNVRFDCWNGNYLAMPAEYQNIVINNNTIDSLNFELNYAHANLTVKLINAPIVDPSNYWLDISTTGIYPYVYQTSQQMQPDSAFHFRVCEGDWIIVSPYFGDQYVPDVWTTTVNVTEDSSNYYVEIHYASTGIEDKKPIPKSFYVRSNYPNPFNPTTTIEFGIPAQEKVTVSIYNVNGQKIATLVDGTLSPGVHKVQWDGSGVASGMYFYQVQTPKKTIIRKMLLIK